MNSAHANKILWLASYPKSGNTWFRAFLTALFNDGEADINRLSINSSFSSRFLFESVMDIKANELFDGEARSMMAEVHRYRAQKNDKLTIVKIHDALNSTGTDSIIPIDTTLCAFYLIRNPLDIAGSLANHQGSGIDEAIALLNDPNGCFFPQRNNSNTATQFTQHLRNWSSHVMSWTRQKVFPVIVVRYEDLLGDPVKTFTNALNFAGFEYTPDRIQRAIKACRFENLVEQEKKNDFFEKNSKSPLFFRKGKMNTWTEELTAAQVNNIVTHHKEIMKEYDYLPKE